VRNRSQPYSAKFYDRWLNRVSSVRSGAVLALKTATCGPCGQIQGR
jgi:hypothetical protein